MTRKVLMMLNAAYPSDIRVKKEAGALITAGFEVHLLCLRKKGELPAEVFEGIHVHRIEAGTNNYQLAFWDVVMSVNFIHPRFRKAAASILKEASISIIHVHDLPLAGTALSLKKSMNVKVVVDFHENYPEALRTWFQWKTNLLARLKNYLFLNPERWAGFEKKTVEQADVIIAVVDEMKARLISEHGANPEKIVVVTNTEDKGFVKQALDPNVYGTLKGKFIVTYSGGIGPHRGVDTAITSMQYLKNHPDIQMAIIGSGSPAVMQRLHQLVNSLGLHNIHFFGYQPFHSFYSFMHFADVNIIPHHSNGHTDHTVPHKLFQGMMTGKSLLVSSSAPLKRLVEATGSGLVFRAGDAADCAEKILNLYQDAQRRQELGQHGIAATLDGTMNWEETQKELVALYQRLSA